VTERLTRHELKEDPLMKHTGEVVDFAQHHVRMMLIAAGVLLVAVLAVVLIRGAHSREEDKAAGMLAEVQGDLGKGNPDAAAARLKDMLEFHGGTESGKQAILMYADIMYNKGQYDEAATYYAQAVKVVGKDPVLGDVARRGLAATYEQKGDHAHAVEILEKLYADSQSATLKAEVGLDLARNYVALDREQDALRIYDEVGNNPVNTQAAQEAKLRAAEVKVMKTGS
jgi:predicted negative regulator of RcsB-dependent stress response